MSIQLTIKEQILKELEDLNEGELQKVNHFITSLKINAKFWQTKQKDLTKIAELYQEFAEEDRLLAETGMVEYQELLTKEDQL
jgi:hypothetical protein